MEILTEKCGVCSGHYEANVHDLHFVQPYLNSLVCKALDVEPPDVIEDSRTNPAVPYFSQYFPMCSECKGRLKAFEKKRIELDVLRQEIVSCVLGTLNNNNDEDVPLQILKPTILERWGPGHGRHGQSRSRSPKKSQQHINYENYGNTSPSHSWDEDDVNDKDDKDFGQMDQGHGHEERKSTPKLKSQPYTPLNVHKTVATAIFKPRVQENQPAVFTVAPQHLKPPFFCELCGKVFSKLGNLRIHAASMQCKYNPDADSESEAPKLCPICPADSDLSFSSWLNLKFHIDESHGDLRLFKCKSCRGEFLPNTLSGHECVPNSAYASDEDEMKPKPVVETNFLCDECGASCPTMRSLQKHKCGDQPKQPRNLNQPQIGDQIFFCDICGVGLKYARGLDRHMKIHIKDKKRYPCEICGKSYPRKDGLNRHAVTHTREKTKTTKPKKSLKRKEIVSKIKVEAESDSEKDDPEFVVSHPERFSQAKRTKSNLADQSDSESQVQTQNRSLTMRTRHGGKKFVKTSE